MWVGDGGRWGRSWFFVEKSPPASGAGAARRRSRVNTLRVTPRLRRLANFGTKCDVLRVALPAVRWCAGAAPFTGRIRRGVNFGTKCDVFRVALRAVPLGGGPLSDRV